MPTLADVSSDQQNKGLQANVIIDRETASRLGITVGQIDNTLYDAFGQRQVSTIYVARNQYHVIMEVAPKYWQNPQTLKEVYVSTSGGSASGSQTTNAVAGTVVSSLPLAANPYVLAISADDQSLYTGFTNYANLQRYALPGLAAKENPRASAAVMEPRARCSPSRRSPQR